MALTRLIYVSRRLDRTPEALDAILEASRRNNLRDDITGALVVGDAQFLQLLEGPRFLVSHCMARIMQDGRHAEVDLVSLDAASYRLFADWSMHRIDIADVEERPMWPFLVQGAFQPPVMTPVNTLHLCAALSSGSHPRAPELGARAKMAALSSRP